MRACENFGPSRENLSSSPHFAVILDFFGIQLLLHPIETVRAAAQRRVKPIEMVRAPPPRATETTVSIKEKKKKKKKKKEKKRAAASETDRNGACPPESCFLLARD